MQPVNHIKVLCIPYLVCPLFIVAQGIRIPAGAYVIANNGNIVTNNNWINNGRFTHNGGTVVFAGNTQQISGTQSSSFNNLTIATGSNTSILSAGHSIKKILKSDGTLNANNNFTLLANATQTALIDGSGTGEVLGNLTMQGYLLRGYGYKYLGSPFQSATVNEMSDDVNLSAVFPSVYRHDENQASDGWITYTNSANVLSPLRGYAFQMGNAKLANTIDMNGVVTNRNLSISLSHNNQPYTKGFNLVSNPYPSPINWDASIGWTKTNIDNAVYYFDSDTTADRYSGSYSSYVNNVSSDGKANNIIPAMQAYFVHVTNGTYPVSASLGIGNGVRLTAVPQTYRRLGGPDSIPLIRLRASIRGNDASDPTVIYFQNTATEKFDKNLDALKLMNTTAGIPSLYSIAADAQKLSINALPLSDTSSYIPLGVQLLKDGQLSFFSEGIAALPANLYCYLFDAVTKKYHDLKMNTNYEFNLPAGMYESRFSLIFSRKIIFSLPVTAETATTQFQVFGMGRNIQLIINLPIGEKAEIRFINMVGQILFTKTYYQSGSYPISLSLPKGIYQVACYTINTVITKQILIGDQ